MKELTFITGNPYKAKYLSEYFHLPIAHRKLDLPEIQSLDLEEVVRDKVRRAYDILGTPVLVEDVSFTFHALGKLPGPLIKWFMSSLGNEGMCKMLDGYDDRSAMISVMYALCDESGIHIFEGSVVGEISPMPKGNSNFGFDPIFIPNGSSKTHAEMTPDEKHETSMRKPAMQKLSAYLKIKGYDS